MEDSISAQLRLNALSLAKDILTESYNVKRENLYTSSGTLSGDPGEYPTPDDIIKTAEKFSSFIVS